MLVGECGIPTGGQPSRAGSVVGEGGGCMCMYRGRCIV